MHWVRYESDVIVTFWSLNSITLMRQHRQSCHVRPDRRIDRKGRHRRVTAAALTPSGRVQGRLRNVRKSYLLNQFRF